MDVPYRLTGAQRAIWDMERDDPGTRLWVVGGYVEIRGPLDHDRLAAAVRSVVRETESLRVRFVDAPGGPYQVVTDADASPMRLVDLRGTPDPDAAAEQLMWAEFDRPMALSDPPLREDTLFQVGPDRFLWFRRRHHLVQDGYGSVLVDRRIADVYSAPDAGASPAGFSSLATVLEDESRYEASARAEVDRQFWAERLGPFPDVVNLAGRHPHPPYRRPVRQALWLPPPILTGLRAVAHAADTTLPKVIIAAVARYVAQGTGSREIVVHVPVHGRLDPVARQATAVLANRIPLRVTVPPHAGPLDIIRHVATQFRAARPHQRCRIDNLLRDRFGTLPFLGPKVNVWTTGYHMTMEGNPVRVRTLHYGPVNDLSVLVDRDLEQGGLTVQLHANPDLYSAEELRMHRHGLRELLTGWAQLASSANRPAAADQPAPG